MRNTAWQKENNYSSFKHMIPSLILLRGVPGSGKSTLAKTLSENGRYPVFAIDDYFTNQETGNYLFDFRKNHLAYAECKAKTEIAMQSAKEKIFVDNTFVFDWEFQPYFELAAHYNYCVFSIVVENYHGNKNVHAINGDDIQKMATKFKVKLF